MNYHTRRTFLRSSLLGTLGVLTGGFGARMNMVCAGSSIDGGGVPGRRVLADLHCHPFLNAWNTGSNVGQAYPFILEQLARTTNTSSINWERCHRAGIDLMTVAHYNPFDELASMPADPNRDAPAHADAMFDQMEFALEHELKPYACLVKSGRALGDHIAAMDKAGKGSPDYRIAVVHAFEGAHAFGADLGRVEWFKRRGLAMVLLSHFFTKGLGSSGNSLPFFADGDAGWSQMGLTDFGRDLVKELVRHGIIIDITHGTPTLVDEVLSLTGGYPIVASHSSARALGNHPYSLTDEHIQEIARRGGVIGVICEPWWLSNFANEALAERVGRVEDVVRTVRYIYKITGNNDRCIGIGSDFSGYITPASDFRELDKIDMLRQKLSAEFGDVAEPYRSQLLDRVMADNVIEFYKTHWEGVTA